MRRIMLSLLPLLVAAPLAAQAMVGFRAGLNRSTVSGEGDLTQDARMGMIVGVDAAFPLANSVELRVGGAYAQKGSGVSEAGVGSVSFKVDYFQVSALARMGTPRDGDGPSFGVLFGPWVASNLSCNASANLDLGEFGSISGSESCGNEFNGMDFGVAAGAGVELAVSEGLRLGLDVLYAIGLANIIDESFADESENGKNRSLTIQAGVVIPLGG